MVRQYLGNRKKNSWLNEQINEVDCEHLDLAVKNKPDMYKIWRSNKKLGFCGTRVQVGLYSGTPQPDERCTNYGRRKTAAHLLLCSNEESNNTVEVKLGQWPEKDSITDQELAFWIPKYILMWGDKPFAHMGAMSPWMKALAQSQDMVGFHNFMEGHITTHFYEIQNFPASSTATIGLSNSSWKYFTSRTPNGSSAISLSPTR